MEKTKTDYLDEARNTWNSLTPKARKVLAYWLNLTYGGTLCQQRREKGFCQKDRDENSFIDPDPGLFNLAGNSGTEVGNKADAKTIQG